jgi:hypothetical protein
MCADIFSTWYYLNIAYVGESEGILTLVIRYVATLFFTFLFFSFGSELWAAIGWELISKNWREALRTFVEDWEFGLAPLFAVAAYFTKRPSQRRSVATTARPQTTPSRRAQPATQAQRTQANRPVQSATDGED